MPISNSAKKTGRYVLIVLCAIAAVIVAVIWLAPPDKVTFSPVSMVTTTPPAGGSATSTPATPPPFLVTHIQTPNSLHAVYFTSWAAGTPSFQKQMFSLFEATGTELNAIVIDIKDYSGRIGYVVLDPRYADKTIDAIGSAQNRIPNIEKFIASLHSKGVYVIGRIQNFEDPYALKTHPEWYVKKANDTLWKDASGAYWLDPDNQEAWGYLVAIAKQGYDVGFDEINFDYVRFPSDGSVNAAVYNMTA